MEVIKDFFTNSWVVSILTGIVVYIMTKVWETIRAKKQYMQSVSLANKEVFNTLKLCIPEDELPSIYVLQALHLSTSKQYSVKQLDMDNLSLIIFDLIKEIMDSNFLSYEAKIKYCLKLEALEQCIIKGNSKEIIDDSNTKIGMKISAELPFKGSTLIFPLIGAILAFAINSVIDGHVSFEINDIFAEVSLVSLAVAFVFFILGTRK